MDRLTRFLSGAGTAVRPLPLLALVVLVGGCGGGGSPAALLDGSPPPAVPRGLEGLEGPVVMTRVRVVPAQKLDRAQLRECLHDHRPVTLPPQERIVERTGATGTSLTFRGRPLGWIRGCDASAGPTEAGGHWCSEAAGRLRPEGRLFDPRLNIGCLDTEGRQIGFAWLDPLPRARYVAVEGPGYAEVYETAGGLPVRVTTRDVHSEGSSATFRVTQYAAAGRGLSRRTIRAVVAG